MADEEKKKLFYILTIDGGGIRGVFPAHILLNIQKKLGIKLKEQFSLVSGTSTGSIIAASVATGIELEEVISFYKEDGPKIFKNQYCFLTKILKSLCNSLHKKDILSEKLFEVFGDKTLGEVDYPLIIPSTDIGNGRVFVFKSSYSLDFIRDKTIKIKDAVLASCSAPTYFDPTRVEEYFLADGGLWANNPSLAAIIDAKRHLGVELDNIRVLSIGTGTSKRAYSLSKKDKWGLLNGWKATKLVEFFMSLQSQSTNNYLNLLLNENQILRLDYETDLPLPLDDYTIIDDLITRADQIFTYRLSEIENFLSIKQEKKV